MIRACIVQRVAPRGPRRAHAFAWALAGLAACAALSPRSAAAQVPLPPSPMERGFVSGAFRIQPWLKVEGGYDTNLFYLSDKDAEAQGRDGLVDAALIRAELGLRVHNPEFEDVRFRFEGSALYRQYFAVDPNAADQSRIGGQALVDLGFFEKGAFSFGFFDHFHYVPEPPNFSSQLTFDRVVNRAGARFGVHPGGVGGRKALTVGGSYSYEIQRFMDIGSLDQDVHEGRLFAEWRFFPKTALVVDASVAGRLWDAPDAAQGRVDSIPFRATAGLNGFFTKKIALLVRAGYGQGFYAAGRDIQTFIGSAVLSYLPVPTAVLSLGYQRDFVDSYYSNFYVYDRVFVDYKQRFVDRVEFGLAAEYQHLDYADTETTLGSFTVSTGDRREHVVEARASLVYDIARFISIHAEYRFTKVFSDWEQRDGARLLDAGGYLRHAVMAGFTVTY